MSYSKIEIVICCNAILQRIKFYGIKRYCLSRHDICIMMEHEPTVDDLFEIAEKLLHKPGVYDTRVDSSERILYVEMIGGNNNG